MLNREFGFEYYCDARGNLVWLPTVGTQQHERIWVKVCEIERVSVSPVQSGGDVRVRIGGEWLKVHHEIGDQRALDSAVSSLLKMVFK